ncbi:hypothetical protein N7535_001190 [Penicillium sp. DV-2018c]|nr:hypothetical protein N7461_005569 [Penicillium sp. DV-2018c]KAJ5582570.1 hypothetical protein N7535_001190 [Penicillium sp. DV-2018c]
MPSLEVKGPSEDSPGLDRPLMRSHKTLPRRGVIVPTIEVIQPVSPDPNAKPTATPAPPLTPPGAGPEQVADDESTPRKIDPIVSDLPTSGMLTPRQPSKPLTPDVTPPRTNSSKRPTLNQFSYFSSSSRADSFQTALENISSEEDMDTPVRMSKTPTQSARQRRQPSKPRSANIIRTPPSTSQKHADVKEDTAVASLDGGWAANPDGSPTALARKRKSAQNNIQPVHQLAGDALDIMRLDASLLREQSLRDRIDVSAHELKASPSMEKFREEIGWPSSDGPGRYSGSEARPLSGVSTSTVEALIIDSPKRAQRVLRHTEKRSSLRSASSPLTKSERSSYGSLPGSQRRLVHKAARISDQSSKVSSSARTSNSAIIHPNIETINVVVIPERASSLNSRPNSYSSSKPESQRSVRRPPTISTVHTEVPRQTKRTVSDSLSVQSRETGSRSRSMGRPAIPPRSSSLSAPTSRDNSRATSLTSNIVQCRAMERAVVPRRSSSPSLPTSHEDSRTTSLTTESLRSHDLAMDLEMQKRRDNQPVSPPRHNVLASPDRHDLLEVPTMHAVLGCSDDDLMTLHPPSLPFTQGSIPSSSPGPVEIQEATAISLFAHNNRSLLLVDPRGQASSQRPLHALRKSHDRDHPMTPDRKPSPMGVISVYSPLKNPRTPPKPPITEPLPSIPSQATQDEKEGLSRRWSSVRRPWRPRSDSLNSIARSFSMKSAKNRTTGKELDSRLHPFWRPRGFWDDVPSSPEKEPSPMRRPAPALDDDSMVVNNSLGLPQQRIIFDGPPPLHVAVRN